MKGFQNIRMLDPFGSPVDGDAMLGQFNELVGHPDKPPAKSLTLMPTTLRGTSPGSVVALASDMRTLYVVREHKERSGCLAPHEVTTLEGVHGALHTKFSWRDAFLVRGA